MGPPPQLRRDSSDLRTAPPPELSPIAVEDGLRASSSTIGSCQSNNSEWSDPCGSVKEDDQNDEEDTLDGQQEDNGHGIWIPSFLQPLLGLDFVPYSPSEDDDEDCHQGPSDPELSLLAAEVSAEVREKNSASGTRAEFGSGLEFGTTETSRDDGLSVTHPLNIPTPMGALSQRRMDLNLDEVGLEEFVMGGDLEVTPSSTASQRRRRFAPFRSEARRKSTTNRDALRTRMQTWKRKGKRTDSLGKGSTPDSSLVMKATIADCDPSVLLRTPKRSGASPRGTSDVAHAQAVEQSGGDESLQTPDFSGMILLMEQQKLLDAQVQQLVDVGKQACTVQQRANETQRRIVALQQEATQLQQTLQQTLQALHKETMSFAATQTQLDHLNLQADLASQNLQKMQTLIQPPNSAATNSLPTMPVGSRRRSATEDNTTAVRSSSLSGLLLASSECVNERKHIFSPLSDPLQETASPNRRRANTAPQPEMTRPSLRRNSLSFMRVDDLIDLAAFSSISSFEECEDDSREENFSEPNTNSSTSAPANDFFCIDENVKTILQKLCTLGLEIITDESDRFVPTRDTRRILQTKQSMTQAAALPLEWPFAPWHVARDRDVLVWIGGVPHSGFGHDWPVVKARGIVHTEPRVLLNFLLDSTQIKRYNKMSAGRENVLVLQDGVDTPADESPFGMPGDVRILRSINKPKLLPKSIEMLSLWWTQPLEQAPGSYMIVNRSVWESDKATTHNKNHHNMLRSEMLLGVQVFRPIELSESATTVCEMTTITHAYSPGVPEMLAKRSAPNVAAGMIRDIQSIFPPLRK